MPPPGPHVIEFLLITLLAMIGDEEKKYMPPPAPPHSISFSLIVQCSTMPEGQPSKPIPPPPALFLVEFAVILQWEMVADPEHHIALVEENKEAINIFLKRKKQIDEHEGLYNFIPNLSQTR